MNSDIVSVYSVFTLSIFACWAFLAAAFNGCRHDANWAGISEHDSSILTILHRLNSSAICPMTPSPQICRSSALSHSPQLYRSSTISRCETCNHKPVELSSSFALRLLLVGKVQSTLKMSLNSKEDWPFSSPSATSLMKFLEALPQESSLP